MVGGGLQRSGPRDLVWIWGGGAAVPLDPAYRGAPCESSSTQAVLDEGWEVLLPWDELEDVTSELRVGYQVVDPGNHGGSWDPNGGRVLVADHGFGLVPEIARKTSASSGSLSLVAVAVHGEEDLNATLTGPDGTYRWTLWHHARVLHTGEVDVEQGVVEWVLPYEGGQGVVLQAVAEASGGLPASVARPPPNVRQVVTLTTVAFTDEVELAFDMRPSMRGVSVVIRSGDQVLGEATVDLPAGAGVLQIPVDPRWPDEITVSVGELVAGSGRAMRARGR